MTSEINGNASEKKAPLYMKIYEIILSRIETGQYPENSSLPSELDFQKEFNVSRITIRRSAERSGRRRLYQPQTGKTGKSDAVKNLQQPWRGRWFFNFA